MIARADMIREQQPQCKMNSQPEDFIKSMCPVIHDICQPIFERGITMLTYSRIYNNKNTRLYLCSNPEWIQAYTTYRFQDEIDHLEHYVPGNGIKYTLWNGFKMDKVFSLAYNQFNYWHGFTLYQKHKEYIDYYDFSAHKHNDQMLLFFLQNTDMLFRFTTYFKERISNIINSPQKNQLLISKLSLPFNEVPRTSINNSKLIIEDRKEKPRLRLIQGGRKTEDCVQKSTPKQLLLMQNTNIKRKSSNLVSEEVKSQLDYLYNDLQKQKVGYVGHGVISTEGNHTGYFSDQNWGKYYIDKRLFFVEPILKEFDSQDTTFVSWGHNISDHFSHQLRREFTHIILGITISRNDGNYRSFFNIGFDQEIDLPKFLFFNKDLINTYFDKFNNYHLTWRRQNDIF